MDEEVGEMDAQKTEQILSIIIPVYNEIATIQAVVEAVKKADISPMKKEIIIVDDGSSDGTKELLRKVNGAKVFFHEKNKGKGAAIRTGIQHAKGEFMLIQDADLEYSPTEYAKLIHPITRGMTDVVYGSRFAAGKVFDKNMYYTHSVGNVMLTWVTNLLYSAKLEDMETGYKLIKKELLHDMQLESDGFDIEPELTAKLLRKGVKIHEVPITFKPRAFEEGKKINWRDGVTALWTLVKYRVKE